MNDTSGKAGPSKVTNGAHAQSNGVRKVQMNGSSERKLGDSRSSQIPSRPLKRRMAYVDISDEEDRKSSPRNLNSVMANGLSAQPSDAKGLHKKSKGHIEGGNTPYLNLQEQRQELPIARGIRIVVVSSLWH